ncbi:MAG: DUF2779 domain-containing protein, partial [Gemmatimonadota bacterium]
MPSQITKQPFLAALRCPTEGWRRLREEEESQTPALEWKFWVGGEVQRRAQEQLGNGRGLIRAPVDLAVQDTSASLTAGHPLLFEATFMAGPYTARADALRRTDAGWELIEVKSGKAPDDGEKLKPGYLDDLAYTAFVAQQSGLVVDRFILMLINRDYRLEGTAPLMTEVDVSDEIRPRLELLANVGPEISESLLAEAEPRPELKFVCRSCPYFEKDCVGFGIPDPLFFIPRLQQKRFDSLKQFVRISAIPLSEKLTAIQQRVTRVIRSGQAEADHAGLAPLRTLAWPVFYLDFEGVNPALPWFPDAAPYQSMPFQYSLHRIDGPGQPAIHSSYLAASTGDWRYNLCAQLLDDLGDRGSIVVYSNYEKTALNYLARMLPEQAPRIAAVIDRLFDLETMIKNGYCHPGFRGRSSIKNVLPVMVQGPGYADMAILGGESASAIFALMRVGKYDGTATSLYRQQLLDYCALDTLAMVKVHDALL